MQTGPCSGDGCSVNYGGEALWFDPAGEGGRGSLWATGFPGIDSKVGEFALETVLTAISSTHTTLGQLPVASKLQGWAAPLSPGDAGKVSPGATVRLGGIMRRPSDGQLLVNVYTYFGQASTHTSLFLAAPTLVSALTLGGPWEITGSGGLPAGCNDSCREGWTSGAFTWVPPNWQALLGGDTLASGCCFPIISRTSQGPSATVFSADAVGPGTVAGRRLVGYPSVSGFQTLGNWDATVTGTGQWVGGTEAFARQAVIFPEYQTAAFFGTLGSPQFFGYGPPVGQFDTQGGVYYPISEIYGAGTNASTSADGLTVTVPGANLSGITIPGKKEQGIWLKAQIAPMVSANGRQYTAAPIITAKGDSGLPTAWVKVSQPFAPNLTGQAYAIGERTVYDPVSRGGFLPNPVTGHSPFSYPYRAVAWLYDLQEFAAVIADTKKYWDVVPYAVEELPLVLKWPTTTGLEKKSLGGAAYDPSRKLLYLAQQWVGANFDVAITVWRVQ